MPVFELGEINIYKTLKLKLNIITKKTALILAVLLIVLLQLSFVIYQFTGLVKSAPGDGRMILLWDGVSVPSGWTCVSCNSGEPFYQTFPRGADAYGATGGAATHTHTASANVGVTATSASTSQTGTVISDLNHTHSATLNIGAASNLPQYRQLQFIRSNTQGQPAQIPAGAIGLFDATLPSGWASYSAQNGNYIYGESTIGTTGGSNTHSHALSGNLAAAGGATHGTRSGTQIPSAPAGHTHTYSGSGNSSSNEPPYIEVILGQLSITSAPPDGLIAMWDDEIPTNWTKQSGSSGQFNNKFLKGSSSFGTTGGNSSHSHTDSNITSSAPAETAITSRTGTNTASSTHNHNVAITGFSNDSHLPPYRDVIIGKKVPQSTFEQSGYRFYSNTNTSDVGAPLAANNTATTAPPQGQPFRLRMLVDVDTADLATGNKNFKLQYAIRSGTCDISFSGETYNDLSPSSGAIRYYDNSSVNDGAALTTNANDPVHGSDTVVGQTYEESNNFTNTSLVTAGDDAMWDFALVDNSASAQSSYCFRIVIADGSLLDNYNQIPEIITDDGNGHMIIFYDGASAPSGWACVSCISGDPYYQKFIKGAPTYGGSGGSATHSHTALVSVGASNSNGIENQGGSGLAISTHTHTASGSVADGSSLPPYRNLLILRANNSGVPTTLPTGAIAMFDNTVPAGWAQYSAQDGYYIRGEATAGGIGGALTHTHNLTATLNASVGVSSARTNGGTASTAIDGHTHTASGSSQPANNEPPYREMILGKLNAASSVPQNIITFWDNPPPGTWTNLSSSGQPLNQNFVKANNAYGATGGNSNHTHVDSNITSNATAQTSLFRTGTGTADGTHTHQVTFSSFSNSAHEPPYIEAIAAKNGNVNNAPNSPTALKQYRTSDSSEIVVGGYSSGGQVKFEAQATDTDNPDSLQLCVEVQPLGTGFSNAATQCGTAVSYNGSAVTIDVTISGFNDGTSYHWQAATKDSGGALSGWVSYGANAESAADFIDDSSAPAGTVYDGTTVGTDVNYNGGSLSQLAANWSITDSGSGIDYFEYSIGTLPNQDDVSAWSSPVMINQQTVSSLSLGTSEVYYFNVRAFDVAGNNAVVSSNGQIVSPSLSFAISDAQIDFNNLNAGNNFTDTKNITLTTSTNARNGYEIRAYAPQLLTYSGSTIGMFDGGTYASPDEWLSGDYGYGYTSNDSSVNGVDRFLPSTCLGGGSPPCFAPFTLGAPGDIVADSLGPITATPISNEQYVITHRVTTQSDKTAGKYQTTIIYSATAKY